MSGMKQVQTEEESGPPEATEEMESKSLALDSLALYSPLGEMFAPFLDRSMELALDAIRPTYPICVIEVSLRPGRPQQYIGAVTDKYSPLQRRFTHVLHPSLVARIS